METETTPEATATETVEPAKAEGTPVAQEPTKEPNTQSQADVTAKDTGLESSKPKGEETVKKEAVKFFQMRKEQKTAKVEAEAERTKQEESERVNKELRDKIEALENEKLQRADPTSILDDPDKWAQNHKNEIRAELEAERKQQINDDRIAKESVSAEKWLLTRTHLKDPNFAYDVKSEIENNPKIAALASISPDEAALNAYVRVCMEKGVAPDLDGIVSKSDSDKKIALNAGIEPVSAGSGGGAKKWGKGEVTQYLKGATPGTEEHRARLAEVKQAQREGRVS